MPGVPPDTTLATLLPDARARAQYHAMVYPSVAAAYWFMDGAATLSYAEQRHRLADAHPELGTAAGATRTAMLACGRFLPRHLWWRVHAFLRDDLMRSMAIAANAARLRHC